MQDGSIIRGKHVVILKVLRAKLLEELHVGHIGNCRMKALARIICGGHTLTKMLKQWLHSVKLLTSLWQCLYKQLITHDSIQVCRAKGYTLTMRGVKQDRFLSNGGHF